MKKENSKNFNELTYQLNGAAMKVHNVLGCGFQEVIYQRCLAIEFSKDEIDYVRELSHPIYYEGREVGSRRADFVVGNNVVVEIKAVKELEDVHLAQVKNYLVAYEKPVGLLLNFGSESLQIKKVYNPKFFPEYKRALKA